MKGGSEGTKRIDAINFRARSTPLFDIGELFHKIPSILLLHAAAAPAEAGYAATDLQSLLRSRRCQWDEMIKRREVRVPANTIPILIRVRVAVISTGIGPAILIVVSRLLEGSGAISIHILAPVGTVAMLLVWIELLRCEQHYTYTIPRPTPGRGDGIDLSPDQLLGGPKCRLEWCYQLLLLHILIDGHGRAFVISALLVTIGLCPRLVPISIIIVVGGETNTGNEHAGVAINHHQDMRRTDRRTLIIFALIVILTSSIASGPGRLFSPRIVVHCENVYCTLSLSLCEWRASVLVLGLCRPGRLLTGELAGYADAERPRRPRFCEKGGALFQIPALALAPCSQGRGTPVGIPTCTDIVR